MPDCMLDMIVTHYREPWEMGEKFFAMLDLQRGIDFADFRVILVQDGEEGKLSPERFAHRPYKVEMITIPHAGVSAARNAGLDEATADWVMFCDFDDTFANVYALMDIMNVLDTEDCDLLWANFYVEARGDNGRVALAEQGLNSVFNHGKVYRRSFLLAQGLRFDPALPYCEDSLFNTAAYTICDPGRIGKIATPRPLYLWCDTPGSVTNTLKNGETAAVCAFRRNREVCELYQKMRPRGEYCAMVARTVMDCYYSLLGRADTPPLQALRRDFCAWFRRHRREWREVPYETLRLVKDISRKASGAKALGIQETETVTRWLEKLSAE